MKGVIVAAGYGTRFLPVTKTIPKEMLPLMNKPSIAFIAEEFVKSGIQDIIIITSRRKKVMDDFFDREMELEGILAKEGRTDKLAALEAPEARYFFVRQNAMMGTGHALLQVKNIIGDEPCVVAYPDDLHMGEKPLALQLMETHNETGCSVMATVRVPGDVSRYGVLSVANDGFHVNAIVEKPAPGTEPSHEVSIGRFLFTPEFFALLEEGWKEHSGGEYYHIYALNKLMRAGKVVYKQTEGARLDTGEPEGFLEALLTYASTVPAWKKVIQDFARKNF
jgi:UTP--glucose-1-phosphate uridylyltransferase